MIWTNGVSRALIGGLLWGDKIVRFIFVDEAGTSADEPITVVVGVIANADGHVMSAEHLALEALGAIPASIRDTFPFSAKQIMSDARFQQMGWSLTDRLDLLQAMMSIPRRIGMSLCIALQWRGATDFVELFGDRLSQAQWDHYIAFKTCLAVADRNIRNRAGPREIATVVAEDIPEMRQFLKNIPRELREKPITLTKDLVRETVADKEAGYLVQKGDMRVTRIRNSVHFVGKAEDPLVQVADACAYGIRRYFCEQQHGLEFAKAVVGPESMDRLKNYGPPGGAECFFTDPF
jgi:hypothetical protein